MDQTDTVVCFSSTQIGCECNQATGSGHIMLIYNQIKCTDKITGNEKCTEKKCYGTASTAATVKLQHGTSF